MGDRGKRSAKGFSRRDALKLSAMALGGLAVGGGVRSGEPCPPVASCYPSGQDPQTFDYFFQSLDTYNPIDSATRMYIPPAPNEMRITFLGSCIPPVRRAQQMMSVFVEVGNWFGKGDSFVFDCGSGVCSNYGAMGIPFSKMDKVFIAHLHGDHMSDLTHIYCFGPSADRKSPLYVWGPSASGVKNPYLMPLAYDDGTREFCRHFRRAMRWHTESFSFQTTSYAGYRCPTRRSWGLPVEPSPVEDDAPNDGFAVVPIELNWRKFGLVPGDNVAYNNPETGVKITHFPVIHTRQGSIGYKLEWNGLSMIYTSDTKPERHSVLQAINGGNGVDVFIHEMVPPAEVWAFKNMGLDAPPTQDDGDLYLTYLATVNEMTMVQNSSHTPQGAFGHLLSLISPRPRLTVATHFPAANDTVDCAFKSVQAHCPEIVIDKDVGNIAWSFDLMTLKVLAGTPKPRIQQLRALVKDFGFSPVCELPAGMNTPKYHYPNSSSGNPYAQIDRSTEIPPTDRNGNCNYREDGY